MHNAEICVLAALCPAGRLLRNPWHHEGFGQMTKAFLHSHAVLMGRESWVDFPYKEDVNITPWIVSANPRFQLQTRAQYSHVRFTDDLQILQTLVPLKGIWWVLGGFTVYREVLPLADSIEATVVNDTIGAVDLLKSQRFKETHVCPNPFNSKLKCVRYERAQIPTVHMQQMQTRRIC